MNPKPSTKADDNVLQLYRHQPCIICGHPSDPCHIKSRGSGGADEHWNLVALCRGHHIEQHKSGWFVFCQRNPRVGYELDQKGWRFEPEGRYTGAVMKLRRDNNTA